MRSKSFPRCFAGEAGVEPAMCRLPHSLVFSAPPGYGLVALRVARLPLSLLSLVACRVRVARLRGRPVLVIYFPHTHLAYASAMSMCYFVGGRTRSRTETIPGGLATARLLYQLSYPALAGERGSTLFCDAPPRLPPGCLHRAARKLKYLTKSVGFAATLRRGRPHGLTLFFLP